MDNSLLLKCKEIEATLPNLKGKELYDAYEQLHDYYGIFDIDKAIMACHKSIEIAQELNDRWLEYNSESSFHSYVRQVGKYEEALEGLIKLLPKVEKEGYKDLTSAVYNNMGIIYYGSDQQKALECYLKALEYSRAIGAKKFMAIQLRNIADLQVVLNNITSETIASLNESVQLFEELNEKAQQSYTYTNLAKVYLRLERYDESLIAIDKSKEIAATINHSRLELTIQEFYLDYYFKIKDYKSCKTACEKIEPLYRDLKFNIGFKMVYHYLGISLLNEKKLENARTNLLKSKEIAQDVDKFYVVEVNEGLIEIALLKKEYKQAFDLQKESREIEAERLSEEKTKAMLRMQNEFESVRKDKENAELKLKALRSQMSPHFIFNSLNAIQSFVADNNNIEAIKYIGQFAKLMRQILQGSESGSIKLEEEIDFLNNYLRLEKLRFNNLFNYSITVNEEVEADFIKIPPMLLQPYIENSILHGMKGKKEDGWIKINIDLSDDEDILVVTIDDNGIGRKKAMELSKTRRKHKSLGLQITQERLSTINNSDKSSIQIIDKEDNKGNSLGTKVILTMPV